MAAGAAALILGRSGADPDADPALRRLVSALGADVASQVDGWSADGPDGEQILCLTDLLHRRALEDDTFRRWMTLAAAPPKAVPALRALAERCREQGHRAPPAGVRSGSRS